MTPRAHKIPLFIVTALTYSIGLIAINYMDEHEPLTLNLISEKLQSGILFSAFMMIILMANWEKETQQKI